MSDQIVNIYNYSHQIILREVGTTVFTANMKNQAIKELVDTKVFQQVKILK
jgi:hypothetical protein